MTKQTAYLSLGSNMGDRDENLIRAIVLLNETNGIDVTACSDVYETEPVGYSDQDFFLNLCLKIETTLDAYELLKVVSSIELKLHRVRLFANGPRTMDIDILLFDDMVSDDPKLTIPHPRMYERAFVLCPLKDIMEYDGPIPEDKSVRRYRGPYI